MLDVGYGAGGVTEAGLVAVSVGCSKLNSILYSPEMTNVALITVAKNCPNLIRFKLYNLNHTRPDPVTKQPLDEGFGASCGRARTSSGYRSLAC